MHYEEVGGHVYSLPTTHPEAAKCSALPEPVIATQQVHLGHDVPRDICEGALYAVPKRALQKKASSAAEQAPLKTGNLCVYVV